MDFLKTLMISSAGLKVQTGRMRIIAENVANSDSVASTPGGDPYRRQIPTVTSKFDKELGAEMVRLGKVVPDRSDFELKYEPNSPAADARGNVKYPNVSPLIEMVDMQSAQRTYEANLNVVSSTRAMLQKTIDILRG
ncbi:flagellar basal body rod protein FlgC [Pleomorphomonas diazotrophica]|uniref:Flagellar basal-body rod protein FlgC n=1 Tax=Pleomorphomonas diazotrophica TaxID=1166257 RepID=A0A1I4R5F0_9HYPH|nr:flagellar basal body rod protein FlgC [Pleomorphomonas diazotrophica]PKR90184.1 flagellar basal body rod protein FlgC [Pleomorphomonas diazotrophica]SFM47532.1 flagellar basal-body rod protein FlgC [Pleomorphomonas diazotrophica]